jgi:predicted glycosyltransferase
MSAPRVLFYVQHLLGIGHLVRASRIARAMAADGFEVTIVSGGVPVEGFPGEGIESIGLPPIKAADEHFRALLDAQGAPVGEAVWERRRTLLVDLLTERRPDIVMVEAFPFGRRQMRRELLPFLEAARASRPQPLIVSSVRDILQENKKPGRAEETVETLRRFFDRALVHGDARFKRLEDTFPLANQISDMIAYTGLVAGPPPAPATERFAVVVSAGGGAAGGRLVGAALSAAARLAGSDAPWCIITGPNFAYEGQVPPHVRLEKFRVDFPSLLAGARLSVSQAGYNTVCDILRAGPRSILVPFAAGGETEQTLRAQRLAALNIATVISEAKLDGDHLATAVSAALNMGPPQAFPLDLDGARRTAEILRQDLAIKRARSA